MLALARGETINAGWLLFAAIASYAIGYRFYARFIQTKVLETDDSRATPAERLNNGRDFEPMDRRVLFGHHFAAIAGAGPDRKSTRLNSSHANISYAVFCLKKKKTSYTH